MSGPAFTPGPWSIDGQALPQAHPALVIAVQDFVIAEVFADCDTEEPEVQANAHLIQAAPELFEALEQLHREIMGKPVGGGDGQTFTLGSPSAATLNKANAALRKARGESKHHASL